MNCEARAEYFEEKYRQEVFLRSTYELTARNAALEEAALLCDDEVLDDVCDFESNMTAGSNRLAAAIRALKDGELK